VKRLVVLALCVFVWGCADAADDAARHAYELTLPVASDGSGLSITRDVSGRVATWHIRVDGAWNKYVEWVRPRLMKEFNSVTSSDTQRVVAVKSLTGDVYTLELRGPDPPQGQYATATFTARPN
jgi:hypothetical protein